MAITELQIEETNNKINEAREAIEAKSTELIQKLTQIQQIGQCEQLTLAQEALVQVAESEKKKILDSIPEDATFTTKRIFPNVHGLSAIIYQNVEIDKNKKITRYGDIFIKARNNKFTGSGYYTNNASETSWLRVNIPDEVEIIEVYSDGAAYAAVSKDQQTIYVWGRIPKSSNEDYYFIFEPWSTNFNSKIIKVLMGKMTRASNNIPYESTIVIILENGKIWSWGCNRTGQLGIGEASTTHSENWQQVFNFPAGHKPIDGVMAHSGQHGYVILITEKEGKRCLVGWGNNDCGQLGMGDTTTLYKPTVLPLPKNNEQIYKVWAFSQTYSKTNHVAITFITSGTDPENTSLWGAGYNGTALIDDSKNQRNRWARCSVDTTGADVTNIVDIVGLPYNNFVAGLDKDNKIHISGRVPCDMGALKKEDKPWRKFDANIRAKKIYYTWHTNNYDNQSNVYPTLYFKNQQDNLWYMSGYAFGLSWDSSTDPIAATMRINSETKNYKKVPGSEKLDPADDNLSFSSIYDESYNDHGWGFGVYAASASKKYILAMAAHVNYFPIPYKAPALTPVPGTWNQ